MNRTLSTIFAITLMAFGAHGADAQTMPVMASGRFP